MDSEKGIVSSTDSGYAPSSWEFDAEVTRVFDDMLRRSIPAYEQMRYLVTNLGQQFIRAGAVVDLGCSRGQSLAPFVELGGRSATYHGVDTSPYMVEAARKMFSTSSARVDITQMDLRVDYPAVMSTLTLAVLTLQFIPLELRAQVVQNVYDHLAKGGAFIMVEKITAGTVKLDRMMIDTYHTFKHQNGYSYAEIDTKRQSLSRQLVPLTAKANEQMLVAAGFDQVECFWRWANFAGWIAVRTR